MTIFRWFCIIIISIPIMGSSQADMIWTEAMQSYQSKNYAKAIEQFNQILDIEGQESASLYYNLASAYDLNGELGQSVLAYERALRLSPNDTKIQENLSIMNKRVTANISEIPPFFLLDYWHRFASLLSPFIWFVIQFLSVVLGIVAAGYWILSTKSSIKKRGFQGMILFLLLFFISIWAGYSSHYKAMNTDHGIILENASALYQGADDRSESITPLSEGVKVLILDQIENWSKVKLVDQEVGWVKTEWIEII